MRLSKLTGFLSSLGLSLVLGCGSAMATTPTEIEAETGGEASSLGSQRPMAKSAPRKALTVAVAAPVRRVEPLPVAEQTELESQREDLAENPLCRLASMVEDNPPEVFTHTAATQAPSKFSGLVSGFLRKLLQVMGLEQFIQQQTVPTPKVAVIPQPLAKTGDIASEQPIQTSPARLVSTSQPKSPSIVQNYQLWVKGHPIANIRSQDKAELLAQRLERLIDTTGFSPLAIAPTIHHNQPAIAMGGQILFVVDASITREDILNHEVLAIRWANNLRLALNAPALDLATAQQQMYQIEETDTSLEGLASWYGPYFHGRLTANGEIYDQYAFTAAHPSMPLNTYLKVTNLNNDQSVIIRLNDRGPYIEPRSLDLSLGAARCLNSVQTGVIPYKATIMKRRPAIATEAI